ncbi:hypothetical protein ID866_10680, partial [Astraeus odoratus]
MHSNTGHADLASSHALASSSSTHLDVENTIKAATTTSIIPDGCDDSAAPLGIGSGSNTISIPRSPVSAVAPDLESRMPGLNLDDTRDYFKFFRVLIVGRANAGKTSILQRVCNTTASPEVFDGEGRKISEDIVKGTLERGHHDIRNELVFKSNPGFIFHDSRGFEAGSEEEFEQMKKFVLERATTPKLAERIHA